LETIIKFQIQYWNENCLSGLKPLLYLSVGKIMNSANSENIKHILNGAVHRRHVCAAMPLAKPSNTDRNLIFGQILSSCRMRQANPPTAQPTGLKAADYLANPLPSRFASRVQLSAPARKFSQSHFAGTSSRQDFAIYKQTAQKLPQQLKNKLKSDSAHKTDEILTGAQTKPLAEQKIIEKSVSKAAKKYNLAPALICAVIKAESNFQVDALSRAGAQGLMQLMPATAQELGVKDPYDIEQNVDGGSHYLRKMLDRFDGNLKLALAAYNAGPGTVEKYGRNVPPYQETRNYVARVLRFSGKPV
jgi:soluble lytic murein transglycosylase-like protein